MSIQGLTFKHVPSVTSSSAVCGWFEDSDGDMVGVGHGWTVEEARAEAVADALAVLGTAGDAGSVSLLELVTDLTAVTAEMRAWRESAEGGRK